MRLLILLAALFFASSHAHNWMMQPQPYGGLYKRIHNCRQPYCNTACQKPGRFNSRSNPAETYQRGETITVKWTRNNHRGGFVRIALVPVEKMNSRTWHTRFTIMHGCWEAGRFKCPSRCGTDKGQNGYQRRVKIPDVYPDGDYVLGHLWYGGIEFTRSKGWFGDFYSCSHVRIRGGSPVSSRAFSPYWEPGSGEHVRNGECQTSAAAVGDCDKGCKTTRSFWTIPTIFKNGAKPRSYSSSDVKAAMNGGGDAGSGGVTGKSGGGKSSGGGRSSGGGKSSGGSGGQRGICRDGVCCASSCGRCGGNSCHRLRGGWKCCRGAIRKSGRRCSRSPPPCVQ